MDHYNDVARTVNERPDRYGPLFAIDKRHNEILWEIWVAGFEKAAQLRPATWQKLLTADHETAQAMSGLLTLADVDRRDPRFTPKQPDALRLQTRSGHGLSRSLNGCWRIAPRRRMFQRSNRPSRRRHKQRRRQGGDAQKH